MGQKAEAFNIILQQEFNALQFYTAIMQTIESFRSNYSIGATVDLNPRDLGDAEDGETHMNAFFRILGLPAIRPYGEAILPDNTQFSTKLLDQEGSLNLFPLNAFADPDETAQKVVNRETNFRNKKRGLKESLLYIYKPLNMLGGDENPRRTSLFPMLVNGDVAIYPVRTRTAPLFYSGDFISSRGARLPRSFLETILFMRTFTLSGVPSDIKDQLKTSITANIKSVDGDLSVVSDVDKFGLLELQIINKLIMALSSAANTYNSILNRMQILKSQTLFVPVLENKDPAIIKQVVEASKEEMLQLIESDPELNSIISPDAITELGVLDRQIQQLVEAISAVDAGLSLYPTEQLKELDIKLRQVSDGGGLINITQDVFLNEFDFIVRLERNSLAKRLGDLEGQHNQTTQEWQKVTHQLEMLTGEVRGISVFDILAVFLALFTIDLADLQSLLNPEANARFSNHPLFSRSQALDFSAQDQTGPINQAVFSLEAKVLEYLSFAKDKSLKIGSK